MDLAICLWSYLNKVIFKKCTHIWWISISRRLQRKQKKSHNIEEFTLAPFIICDHSQTYIRHNHTKKNPAYGRHWLSWPLRIVEPIPWYPLFLTLFCTFIPFVALFFLAFYALFRPSWHFFALFVKKKNKKNITFHVSRVTCQMSITPTDTATDLPLLTPLLSTHS